MLDRVRHAHKRLRASCALSALRQALQLTRSGTFCDSAANAQTCGLKYLGHDVERA